MTETIGWGDVDIDIAPPRQRRFRGVLLWSAVIAVVAGVALAPSARARLAGGAVAWLDRTWAKAQAYDATRIALEDRGIQRSAPGDAPLYMRLVSLVDREEASRLRGLAHSVAGHRTWASDVHSTAVKVRRALLAEARDLDVDAGRTADTFRTEIYLATPTQSATQSLLFAATHAVDALVGRHHVRVRAHVRPADAPLTTAAPVLGLLNSLTDTPLDLRLAISHDDTLDVWDLATGKGRRDVAIAADPEFIQPLVRLGDDAVFAAKDGPRLVRPDGTTRPIGLPTRAEYVPGGDGSLWVDALGTWKHYDGNGRLIGPVQRTPLGYSDGAMAASGNSVVIAKSSPMAGTQAAIWTPSTGRLVPIPGSCDGAFSGARDAIAFVGCNQLTLSVMNLKTGRLRTVHTPPGTVVDEVAMALSPDGSQLAFRASPLNGIDTSGSLALFDVATGRVRVIARGTAPLSWSADGTTLLVSSDVGENLYSVPLGYWKEGMDRPASIRIPLASQSLSALLLP